MFWQHFEYNYLKKINKSLFLINYSLLLKALLFSQRFIYKMLDYICFQLIRNIVMLYESKLRALMKNAMTRQVILLIQNFRYSISTKSIIRYTYIYLCTFSFSKNIFEKNGVRFQVKKNFILLYV